MVKGTLLLITMVNYQAIEEVMQIEQKYNEIKRPAYEKRDEIIKSIPHFWFTAFANHPVIAGLFNEDDRKIFKYLDSVDVADFKDMANGYSLTFKFNPNPYFEDRDLVKTYIFLDNGMTKISSTSIKWKEGMAPTKSGYLGEIGNKQPLSEESFFSWFAETQLRNVFDGLRTDEVGDIIKEDLWPNPLKYFNMEADEEDSDGDEGDEEEGDDEADEDKSESEEDKE